MADYPAMPWWTDAYLADTRHLTTVQHGAYCLLLMEAWRRPNCSLPNDDEMLAKLACLSPEEWLTHRNVVLAFWRLDARTKTWRQKRQLRERSYVNGTSARQRSAAKSRWAKEKPTSHGTTKRMPNGCQTDAPTPTPTPTPTPIKDTSLRSVNGTKKETRRKHPLPDGWMPEPTDNDVGYALGFIESEIEQEHAKFTDWAIGANALKSNWNATFRNWLRTAAERKESNRVKVQGHQGRHH